MEEEPVGEELKESTLEDSLQEYIRARCEYIVEAEMRRYAEGYFQSMVLPRMIKEVKSQIHTSLVSSRGKFKFEIYYGPKDIV